MKNQESFFTQKVREIAKLIPAGKVISYGMLARAAGGGGQASRSVARILAKDTEYKKIPFHRIVYADGRVWKGESLDKERIIMLEKEGIIVDKKGRIKNFRDHLYFD